MAMCQWANGSPLKLTILSGDTNSCVTVVPEWSGSRSMPRNITYAKLFKLDMIPDIRLSTSMVGTESWDSLFIN